MKNARDRIPDIIRLLRRAYPESTTALEYETPLQILVSTILSAQCTDARVNMITPSLYKTYPDAAAFGDRLQEAPAVV